MFTDEQLDNYITDKLSAQEKRLIEAQLMQDKQLAAHVAEYTRFTQSIENAGWWQWQAMLSKTEYQLENQGFFLTDEELDDYLSGKTEPEVTRQIEQQRFGNVYFERRIEQLIDMRRALRHTGNLQWELLLDKAEEKLQNDDFFEGTDAQILEKLPQPMSPVVKALIAVGVFIVAILLLRWLMMAMFWVSRKSWYF